MAGTVFNMLHKMLRDSEEKLAEEQEVTKTASALPQAVAQQTPSPEDPPDAEKVASALEWFADNIHDVVDDRSAQEKLAEYMAMAEAGAKLAAGAGDNSEGPHQRTKAEAASIPPMNPGTTNSAQAGAGANQMDSGENNAAGTGIEADGGGKANPENTPPKAVQPSEKANPQDAANALETNRADPPGDGEAPMKIAQDIMGQLTKLVSTGQITKEAAAVVYAKRTGGLANVLEKQELYEKMASARASGIPEKFARALMGKTAEDAINPAQISGGTEPVLQSAPGQASPLSQGSEAGQLTPATRGSDAGRELVGSVESAINATKGDAKNVKSEMARYLNEPAQAASQDSVLQQSLDNTSNAGVKIASARALLQKWGQLSPENQAQLDGAVGQVKVANQQMGYGGQAAAGGAPGAPGSGVPGQPAGAMAGGMSGLSAPGGAGPMASGSGGGGDGKLATGMPTSGVSDEALEAARTGVTPEELATAEQLLDATASSGAEPPPEAMGPPPAEEAPVPPVQA